MQFICFLWKIKDKVFFRVHGGMRSNISLMRLFGKEIIHFSIEVTNFMEGRIVKIACLHILGTNILSRCLLLPLLCRSYSLFIHSVILFLSQFITCHNLYTFINFKRLITFFFLLVSKIGHAQVVCFLTLLNLAFKSSQECIMLLFELLLLLRVN